MAVKLMDHMQYQMVPCARQHLDHAGVQDNSLICWQLWTRENSVGSEAAGCCPHWSILKSCRMLFALLEYPTLFSLLVLKDILPIKVFSSWLAVGRHCPALPLTPRWIMESAQGAQATSHLVTVQAPMVCGDWGVGSCLGTPPSSLAGQEPSTECSLVGAGLESEGCALAQGELVPSEGIFSKLKMQTLLW